MSYLTLLGQASLSAAVMILAVAATVASLFVADGTLSVSRTVILGTCAAFGGAALVSEMLYYRSNQKTVVR